MLRLLLSSALIMIFSNSWANDAQLEKDIKKRENEIKTVAQDFESVMISQTFRLMTKGIKTDPVFGGGKSEEIYRDMLMDEYGKNVAKNGGFGLAKHIQKDIQKSDSIYNNLMREKNASSKQ
jgi:Rod binding domain-containing protein